jgi:oxygen-independent coproporphyrinogen III oxidase
MDFALYLHIPFCSSKCGYCDFFSLPNASESDRATYGKALLREIERALQTPPFDEGALRSLYLGGGTPSLMPLQFFKDLLDPSFCVQKRLRSNAEITVEANPESVSENFIRVLSEGGVRRISLGVQSFQEKSLQLLGRQHTVGGAHRAIERVRGCSQMALSLDLMTQLPTQNESDLERDLHSLLSYAPEHLSVYGLGFESGTPLDRARLAGRVRPLSAEKSADIFLQVSERLEGAGYIHYEVSNFAQVGQGARHNTGYWLGETTLGIGAGATSQVQQPFARWQTPQDINAFLAAVEQGQAPERLYDRPDDEARLLESLYLALRWVGGVQLSTLEKNLCPDRFERLLIRSRQPEIRACFERGQGRSALLSSLFPKTPVIHEHQADAWCLAPRDWLLLDELVVELTR